MGRRWLPGAYPRNRSETYPFLPSLIHPTGVYPHETFIPDHAAYAAEAGCRGGRRRLGDAADRAVQRLRANAPSKKLNIAMLACGGRARDNLRACMGSDNIVALCDVDQRQVAEAKKDLARIGAADKVKVYEDYRKLLDQEKSVDAVVIAPGHAGTSR